MLPRRPGCRGRPFRSPFNSPEKLSAATRDRILAAAQELSYVPNTLARMLKAGQTQSLGVLLPQNLARVMENPYYARFLTGVGQVCDEQGYTMLLTPPLRDSMLKAIPYAAVDGFIVCGLEHDRGEVAELKRRGIPFVLVDSSPREDVSSVDVDDEGGAFEAMRHVLDLGHRRIAVLSLDPGPEVAERGYRGPLARRMTGMVNALDAAGLRMENISLVEVPVTRMDGFRATKRIMAQDPPTAIVAMSDILAFGAMDALHDLELSVPGDVSVTGYDDLPESSWMRPRLTTVRQAITTKGRTAADLLFSAIRDEDQHPHQLLGTHLIVRDSTARIEIASR
ncbi:LacI family DNA-binding transcriptional regulator [Streptomyces sp. S1A(2023)]